MDGVSTNKLGPSLPLVPSVEQRVTIFQSYWQRQPPASRDFVLEPALRYQRPHCTLLQFGALVSKLRRRPFAADDWDFAPFTRLHRFERARELALDQTFDSNFELLLGEGRQFLVRHGAWPPSHGRVRRF